MYIEFEKITFKNFLSYGNKETEIQLNKDNFSLVTGFNGCGKSSLVVDSITWCLFGKLHRQGITQKQIINNVNKKGCEVALDFTINNKKYQIKRGLKPNYLELFKEDKKLDSLSSTTLVQKEIDNLVQMDALTFKNISVLSVNTSKPFVEMSPVETRSITETFLGLKIYSIMLDNVKKRIKDTKDILNNTKKDFDFTKEIVIDGKEKLKKYKELKEKFEQDKQVVIEALEKEKKELETQIEPLESKLIDEMKIAERKKELSTNESDYDDLKQEAIKLDLSIENYDRAIVGKEEEILFFTDHSTCPTCNSEMNDKHRQGHIKTYKKEIAVLEKKIITDTTKMEEVKEKNSKLYSVKESLKDTIEAIWATNSDIEIEVSNIKNRLIRIDSDIKKKNEDTIDNHISGLIDKKKIKEYIEKYKKLKVEKESLDIKIKQLSALKSVLSDEGVKASAIKKDLPFLNTSIKKYMTEFGKDFYIEFSDTFEVTLKGFSKKGLTYHTLSSGERKRIDLSVLLSFIDMTRNKNSVHTNILCLDEICDSSLDAESLEIFISILQNKVRENQLKNVFIISHNPNMSIDDCSRITCYKDGQFSKIKYED